MRDAANGPAFRDEIRARFDIDARTISGDEEARLTFLGATAGRADASETLVIDIGGGSTEYVVGQPGAEPDFHISTRMGSVRHTERHLPGDPPGPAELAALAGDARSIIDADVPAGVRERVEQGIAVAGTATSLAAIDLELDPYDPERVHGHRVSLDTCERIVARLAALTVAERREVDRPASRPRAHDRGGRRDPARVAARLRPGLGRGQRDRHPARRRTGPLKMKAPASCRRLQKRPHQDGQGYVP